MINLESWVQGPFFQDKAQHNAVEPEAPWHWEQRRKAGRRKGEADPGLALVARHLTCPALSTKWQSLPVLLSGHPIQKTPTLCPNGTLN